MLKFYQRSEVIIMTRNQLENLYMVNGLNDFRLNDTTDLLRVHGINYKAVKGYVELDEVHQRIYEKFIVKFFNAQGLDVRALLMPTAINYVEDSDYLVKESPDQDYYNVAGGIVYAIDKSGNKSILRAWEDEDYKHLEKIIEAPKFYLRFEYQQGLTEEGEPKLEWMHVIKEGMEWY